MYKFLSAVALSLLALVAVLFAAPSATAGGSGDFYKTGACTANGGVLKANITNYDTGSGQTYHHGANQPSGYTVSLVAYNGATWPLSSGSSGTKRDGYQYFSSKSADVRVTVGWTSYSGLSWSCNMWAR